MPIVNAPNPNASGRATVRVLITGFGPFRGFDVNPSWLTVRPLHNTILEPEASASISPVTHRKQEVLSASSPKRHGLPTIHITTLKVPVTYAAVLSSVPGFHARPPVLPQPNSESSTDKDEHLLPHIPPPDEGYDLVLHVGVAGSGAMRVETTGHKFGYQLPDVEGKFAPVVKKGEAKKASGNDKKQEAQAEEWFERVRLGVDANGNEKIGEDEKKNVIRGFAEGYESFSDELHTGIDGDALVEYLHNCGIELVRKSTDAGRYLCDFIYYCSLAEAQRTFSGSSPNPNAKIDTTSTPEDNTDATPETNLGFNGSTKTTVTKETEGTKKRKGRKETKVLFLHCPPVDDPLSTEEVTNAIKMIVGWVFQV